MQSGNLHRDDIIVGCDANGDYHARFHHCAFSFGTRIESRIIDCAAASADDALMTANGASAVVDRFMAVSTDVSAKQTQC